MTSLLFAAAFAALAVLNLLLALTAFTDIVKLWPTPHRGSWQSWVFWPLFRGGLGATMLLGIWQFAATPSHGTGALSGAIVALLALAVTIYAYFALGLENTYGADEGLVTTGLYRYSRNPQYVASIAGFAGLAFAAASPETIILCALAIGVYVLMPFTEEPWLSRMYGESYRAYQRETPRFLSVAKIVERPASARR